MRTRSLWPGTLWETTVARNVVGCCLVLVAVLSSGACSGGSGGGASTGPGTGQSGAAAPPGGTPMVVGTTAPWAEDVQIGDLMWTVTQDGLTVTATTWAGTWPCTTPTSLTT